ncbi:response regulators consisting of a CheY-like superfamily [Zymobacter palmae]|uniref:Response regulators consisting of a CheY-like superfamily n=1 Tax=Zymobacter palmae TaxID=33074 RepID=A0A348HHT8_9GAMM|nr:response regulators consisting of a CheY-like superfamily [Zymobacter palmae]
MSAAPEAARQSQRDTERKGKTTARGYAVTVETDQQNREAWHAGQKCRLNPFDLDQQLQ